MKNTLMMIGLGLVVSTGVFAADIPYTEQVRLQEKGEIKAFESVQAAVLQLHPGAVIHEVELDKTLGRYEYEIDLVDANNVEWDVDVDAVTGEILKNRIDD